MIQNDFNTHELPESLRALEKISQNYWWSWSNEGAYLFRGLDSKLWEEVEQNPRLLLQKISDLHLWQSACDPSYTARVERVARQFDEYLNA